MTVSDSQKQQVLHLLQRKTSEREIAAKTGLSRRQIRSIKQQAPAVEDQGPLALDNQPSMTRSAAIAELVKLSSRPGGVRYSEMWPVLRALYGLRINDKTGAWELDMTDNQLRYLKEKTTEAATKQGKTALFIPEWLPRQAPVAANDMLVSMAGWLHDRAQEYVSEFISTFPGASRKHALNELICVAFSQASPEPVQTRCQRNMDNAEQLQRRLGDLASRPAANELYPYPPDSELDRLCV